MDYSKYRLFLLNLDKKDEVIYERLIEDLEYYLLDVKSDTDKLYHFVHDNLFYIIAKKSSTIWDTEKLQFLITNAIRRQRYILMRLDSYTGYHNTDFWARIDRCAEFYTDTKKTRKVISEELTLIKRARKIKKIQDKVNKAEE